MKNFIGVGVSIGLLAGLWTQISIELALITWIGFVAWALFYAAGANREGYVKTLAATLSGVAWAWLASKVLEVATFTGAVAIAVAVLAFILCVQAAVPLLSFIPGAFIGTAVFFGTSFDLVGTVVALVIGASLGWLSAILAAKIQAVVDGTGRATPLTPAPEAA